METLTIRVELPNRGAYNKEELERHLSEYAKVLIASHTNSELKSEGEQTEGKRRSNSPIVSSLRGIARGVEESDLDGRMAKEDFLVEKYNESLR